MEISLWTEEPASVKVCSSRSVTTSRITFTSTTMDGSSCILKVCCVLFCSAYQTVSRCIAVILFFNYFHQISTVYRHYFANGKKWAIEQTIRAKQHAWFPGSRLYLVKNSGRQFAEKNNLKPLEHCVYPRTGAAHAVLEVLGPKDGKHTLSVYLGPHYNNHMFSDTLELSKCGKGEPIKYIIDATIGYPHGVVPNISEAMMGEWPSADASEFAVHYDVIPVKPEWSDEEKLKEFLYERYAKKVWQISRYKTSEFML